MSNYPTKPWSCEMFLIHPPLDSSGEVNFTETVEMVTVELDGAQISRRKRVPNTKGTHSCRCLLFTLAKYPHLFAILKPTNFL